MPSPETEYRNPPSRSDYIGARDRLALVGEPRPPKSVLVNDTHVREVDNPHHDRVRYAQHSATADREIVERYESWADDHAQLHADARERIALGLAARLDESLVDVYERHVAERVAAGELPGA